MIIGGIILFPLGIVSIMLGLFFIWLLRNSARQEKIEKHLNKIAGIDADVNERAAFKEWYEKKSKLEQE